MLTGQVLNPFDRYYNNRSVELIYQSRVEYSDSQTNLMKNFQMKPKLFLGVIE